jgi:hypothetical protein
VHSEWKGSDNAAFTQTAGDWYTDADRDKGTLLLLVPCVRRASGASDACAGIMTSTDMKFHTISAKFDGEPLDLKEKTIVIQFSVRCASQRSMQHKKT